MRKTITKRADELKPGDVLVLPTRNIVFRVDAEIGVLRVQVWDIEQDTTNNRWLQRSEVVEVEAPALTPAQQHAEELLELVCDAENLLVNWQDITSSQFDQGRKEWADAAKPLLAKIDPPAPPTLEEALALLARIWEAGNGEGLDAILDRARRSGVYPKEGKA